MANSESADTAPVQAGSFLPFPQRPDYGRGATRRRIRVEHEPGAVRGHLIDNFHEMRCRVAHDGVIVTAIDADMPRHPNSSCPGAADVLRELVGVPLAAATAAFYGGGRARRNCTHLLDLAVLAIAHAQRSAAQRTYDVVVPDACGATEHIEVRRDGELAHAWEVAGDAIVAPAALAGRPLFSGFSAWAAGYFDADALEAATVLARTCLIARGRRYDTDAWKGSPVSRNPVLRNRCHAYADERIDAGHFLGGNVRDFDAGIP